MERVRLFVAVMGVVLGISSAGWAQDQGGSAEALSPPAGEVYTLPQIDVKEKRDEGYAAQNATTALRTNVPIMETPVSVQVVPREVMDDQQAVQLEQVLQNVSNVQREFGWGKLYEYFLIRGFRNDYLYYDGFRAGFTAIDLANVERIEVLKGPAAILYGRTEPGGIINVVRKRPQEIPSYSLEQMFGSYDFYRTEAGLTGPVGCNGALRYRLDVSYQNNESIQDFYHNESFFAAPSFSWNLGKDTQLDLVYQYKRDRFPYENGIPAIGDNLFALPRRLWTGEPEDNTEIDKHTADVRLTHRFNDAWQVRGGVALEQQDFLFEQIFPWDVVQPDGRTLPRSVWFVGVDSFQTTTFLELNGKLDFGWMTHNILFGGDYYHNKMTNEGFVNGFDQWDTLDVLNPVYGTVDFDLLRDLRKNSPDYFTYAKQKWYGLYLQDLISFGKQVHVLLGGRYDWAETISGFSFVSFDAMAKQKVDDDELSPRVGVLYQPTPWLALFGNYVEGLGQGNTGVTAEGKPFDPERSHQYEVGAKTDLVNGRFSATVTYFDLTKENIKTRDLANPGFSVAIGEARSRGIEIDAAGKLTDSLSLIGSYGYDDTEVVRDNRGREGNRLAHVPLNAGSLWLKYVLDKVTLGTGVFAAGERPGDNENTLNLPGYARWDAMVGYSHKTETLRLTGQLNVINLLDKKYYVSTDLVDGVPKANLLSGAPLTFVGSLKVEF